MRLKRLTTTTVFLSLMVGTGARVCTADLLTADRAVKVALEKNTDVVNAEASILDARGGLYGAYSGLLPHISGSATRDASWTNHSVGNQAFGTIVTPSRNQYDGRFYSTTPGLSGSWSVLNLSALSGLSAARGS